MIAHKLATWDGDNKQQCRSYKIQQVALAKARRLIPAKPTMLSLAGAQAVFERALVARRLINPADITTIQSPRKRSESDQGTPILHALMKVRDSYLPGMKIWPEDFSTFASGYKEEMVIPHFQGAASKNAPLWFRIPKFRKEMQSFLDVKFQPFHILDIDLCGAFSQTNGESVAQLFKNQALANSGLLFINHQKGRDITSTNVLDYLKDYFAQCAYWDVDLYSDNEGRGIDLNDMSPITYYQLRMILVPVYYICEAYKHGYLLEFSTLFEYCDRNDRGGGPNMLQWFANFERHSHSENDRAILEENLQTVTQEIYGYVSRLGK